VQLRRPKNDFGPIARVAHAAAAALDGETVSVGAGQPIDARDSRRDIDAPELDARLGRDPEKLEELARDILRRGLIEPIKVFAKGDRFEVIDGFRRFLATRGRPDRDRVLRVPSKAVALEGIKYAANAFREDMSPAEEAIMFFSLLRDECEGDIERLCALVNKKLSYVDNRLALVNGDELVFEAVKDRKITLGVAAELNKLPDDGWRRYYLEHAIQGGATVAVVSGWVTEWKNMYGARVETPDARRRERPDRADVRAAPLRDLRQGRPALHP
jgi:ParB/RepB/Spo0J family partition protein